MISASALLTSLDVLGIFAFGLTGGMVAVRKNLDLFGILVLAAATGAAGGILRDVILGDTPPAAFQDIWPLAVAFSAGIAAFFVAGLVERLNRPVMLLDAIGLGVFAVAGCQKALEHGLELPGAVLLGVVTAVGGGILRDMMVAEVPRVLREEVYALAAFIGALAYGVALKLGLSPLIAATGAGLLAFALRVASVWFGWTLPRARHR